MLVWARLTGWAGWREGQETTGMLMDGLQGQPRWSLEYLDLLRVSVVAGRMARVGVVNSPG